VKARTVRQARVKSTISDEVEVKPQAVDNSTNKGDADKLSAMEKAMRVIRKKLKARSMEEMDIMKQKGEISDQPPDIDLVQFLFNPKSFTQTVENIFNFSFFIKKGEAEIGVRPPLRRMTSSGAYVAFRTFNNPQHDDTENTNNTATATQAICRFTMADWRRLCTKHANQSKDHQFIQGDLPHRTGTKHDRTSL
jgi:Nse4 C-terminal